MSWILLIVLAFVLVAVLAGLKGKKPSTSSEHAGRIGLPYERTDNLFSAAERSFLGILDQAVGAEHRVFAKVRVADLVAVRTGLSNSATQGARNRVAYKHFDFVVCHASDLGLVCAVELDDASHARRKTQSRDELVDDICREVGLPLLRFPAQAFYEPQIVRERFLEIASPHRQASLDAI